LTQVTVISGVEASGKTTYALQRIQEGDLIVDVDAIYAALSGLPFRNKPKCLFPFVANARDAVIERLSRASDVRRAWIITTDERWAKTLSVRLRGQHVHLTITPEEQAKRLNQRNSNGMKEVWGVAQNTELSPFKTARCPRTHLSVMESQ
jgi:hypothetical protein